MLWKIRKLSIKKRLPRLIYNLQKKINKSSENC